MIVRLILPDRRSRPSPDADRQIKCQLLHFIRDVGTAILTFALRADIPVHIIACARQAQQTS